MALVHRSSDHFLVALEIKDVADVKVFILGSYLRVPVT